MSFGSIITLVALLWDVAKTILEYRKKEELSLYDCRVAAKSAKEGDFSKVKELIGRCER